MSTSNPEPLVTLALASTLCVLCYGLTAGLVPVLGPNLAAKGLGGYDMLKPGFKRDEDLLQSKVEQKKGQEVVRQADTGKIV